MLWFFKRVFKKQLHKKGKTLEIGECKKKVQFKV